MVQVKMRSLDWSKHVFGNRRIESCHSVQVYAKQEPTVRDNRMWNSSKIGTNCAECTWYAVLDNISYFHV